MPCRCTSAVRPTPRDAYSSFVARALRDAARADVEAMFRRFGADDRTAEGDPVIARARADVEAILARQGFIVEGQPELPSIYFLRIPRTLPPSPLTTAITGPYHSSAPPLPAP